MKFEKNPGLFLNIASSVPVHSIDRRPKFVHNCKVWNSELDILTGTADRYQLENSSRNKLCNSYFASQFAKQAEMPVIAQSDFETATSNVYGRYFAFEEEFHDEKKVFERPGQMFNNYIHGTGGPQHHAMFYSESGNETCEETRHNKYSMDQQGLRRSSIHPNFLCRETENECRTEEEFLKQVVPENGFVFQEGIDVKKDLCNTSENMRCTNHYFKYYIKTLVFRNSSIGLLTCDKMFSDNLVINDSKLNRPVSYVENFKNTLDNGTAQELEAMSYHSVDDPTYFAMSSDKTGSGTFKDSDNNVMNDFVFSESTAELTLIEAPYSYKNDQIQPMRSTGDHTNLYSHRKNEKDDTMTHVSLGYSGSLTKIDCKKVSTIEKETDSFISDGKTNTFQFTKQTLDKRTSNHSNIFTVPIPSRNDNDYLQCMKSQKVLDDQELSDLHNIGTNPDRFTKILKRRKLGILLNRDDKFCLKKSLGRAFPKIHSIHAKGKQRAFLSDPRSANETNHLRDGVNLNHISNVTINKSPMTLLSHSNILPGMVKVGTRSSSHSLTIDNQNRIKRKIVKLQHTNFSRVRLGKLSHFQRLAPKVWYTKPTTNFQCKQDDSVSFEISKKQVREAVHRIDVEIASCRCSSWLPYKQQEKSNTPPCIAVATNTTDHSIAFNPHVHLSSHDCVTSTSKSCDDDNLHHREHLKIAYPTLTNNENSKIVSSINKHRNNSTYISFLPISDAPLSDVSIVSTKCEEKEYKELCQVSKVSRFHGTTTSCNYQHQLTNFISGGEIDKYFLISETVNICNTPQDINAFHSEQWDQESRTLRKNDSILDIQTSHETLMRRHGHPMNSSNLSEIGVERISNERIYQCGGLTMTTLFDNSNIGNSTAVCLCDACRCPSNVTGINRIDEYTTVDGTSENQMKEIVCYPSMPDYTQRPFSVNWGGARYATTKTRYLPSTDEPSVTANVCVEWPPRSSWTLASNSFGKEPTFECRSGSDSGFVEINYCSFVSIAQTFLESEEVCNKRDANCSLRNSENISWIKETSPDQEGIIPCRKGNNRRKTRNTRSTSADTLDFHILDIVSIVYETMPCFISTHKTGMEINHIFKSCRHPGIDAGLGVSSIVENPFRIMLASNSSNRLYDESYNSNRYFKNSQSKDRSDSAVSTLIRNLELPILEQSPCDSLSKSFTINKDEHSLGTVRSLMQHDIQLSENQFNLNSCHQQKTKKSTPESKGKLINDSISSDSSQRLENEITTSSLQQKLPAPQSRFYRPYSIKKKIFVAKGRIWSLLFLLLTLLSMSTPGIACPTACNCKWKGGKMTVECVNKGLKYLPEHLDHETQVLDFAGNSLGIISREKFKMLGLTNLQRIYVSRCKLEQLDDAAFRGLSNLVELDLSSNKLTKVPVAALEHAPALMRLQLSHNPISNITDGSFSKLKSLITLEMTGCGLQFMEPRSFQGLDKLEWLKLDDNQLKSVPETMLLPKMLHGVDLHNNPWHCDCKLQHLRSWLVKYNVPSSIEPKCSSPMRLETRTIKYVIPEDFACAPEVRPTSLFLDVLEGKNVSFACHVVAEPSADIDWKFNGHPLQNSSIIYDDTSSFYIYEDREVKEETVSHLKIEMVTEAHSGVFQCAAENTAGKMISNFTLRVSVPPTEPVPNDFIEDNFKYVGMALIGLIVLVISLCCILICKCCRRRSRRRSSKKTGSSGNNMSDNDKERQSGPISSMPKYIQMGTPTPKSNGISNAAAPISVIEASPYRSSPAGTPHPNPDLISDSPVEERTKPKKKVSILGVEEVDPNGIVTTRKLDDIVEEYEDSFVCQYDQSMQKNKDYESAQDLLNPPYSNISSCRIIANANPYPLMDIPSDDLQRQNLSPQNNLRYDASDYHGDNYGMPKDDSWLEMNGNRVSDYCNMKNNHTAPAYATMRRNNNSKHNVINANSLVGQQKYPEEYPMQTTGSSYQNQDGRYLQNYGGLIVEKYQSNGTSPTTASTSLTGCDCCPDQKSCELAEAGGRMSGDGCSFDNLLGSCSGGVSAHCCYPETSGGRMFDNSLPENYAALPPPDLQDPTVFGSGPLPPEGWRDSDCMNGDCGSIDCVKDNNQTPWDNMPLSPGTRVLYSPEDGFTNVVHCSSDSDQSRQSIPQQQKSGETLPPVTQV